MLLRALINESVRGRPASRAQSMMDCCVRRRNWRRREERREGGGEGGVKEKEGKEGRDGDNIKANVSMGCDLRRRVSGRQEVTEG